MVIIITRITTIIRVIIIIITIDIKAKFKGKILTREWSGHVRPWEVI